MRGSPGSGRAAVALLAVWALLATAAAAYLFASRNAPERADAPAPDFADETQYGRYPRQGREPDQSVMFTIAPRPRFRMAVPIAWESRTRLR